jgi:hypothetical protein
MATSVVLPDALYKVRRGRVEIVDVPEFGYLVVDGAGPPGGEAFTAAVGALYSVSYGAHFLLKRERGEAPHVMPLEGLWWVEDPRLRAIVESVAAGTGTLNGVDRDRWHWQAMIMQPDPIDKSLVARAIEQARAKNVPALDRLSYRRWREGPSAQLLHIGPYADEAPSVARLHREIAAAGYRPRGRHHEIYLGDPRRSAPEKLRTILRQPIEAA